MTVAKAGGAKGAGRWPTETGGTSLTEQIVHAVGATYDVPYDGIIVLAGGPRAAACPRPGARMSSARSEAPVPCGVTGA